jgi:hypothetical protein
MKISRIKGSNVAIVTRKELMKAYGPVRRSYKKINFLSKAQDMKKVLKYKSIPAPANMGKLLDLLDVDGWHYSCVDAIAKGTIMYVKCKNKMVQDWLDNSQNPMNLVGTLRTAVQHYQGCGNGILTKLRDKTGEWIGLELLKPQEIDLKEWRDAQNFLKPYYIQRRGRDVVIFPNEDIIHIIRPTHKSDVWGSSSLPVAQNIETMKQIKMLTYNSFKNGLMIDYFIIVQGGTLNGSGDDDGDDNIEDSTFNRIRNLLSDAVGPGGARDNILLESEDPGSEIKLIPVRQSQQDGEYLKLKEDIRNETSVYHRVPSRIIGQQISGSLGGDNNSDMTIFHNFNLKPIQGEIATLLSDNFREEFGWSVSIDDWDFGNLTDVFKSSDELAFENARKNNNS